MSETGMAWAEGEEAVAAVAPEGGLFARLDPVSLGSSLVAVGRRTVQNPIATAGAYWRFALCPGQDRAGGRRALGGPGKGAGRAAAGQGRWRRTRGSRTRPGSTTRRSSRSGRPISRPSGSPVTCCAAGQGDPVTDAKARLAIDLMLAGLAPTNYFATNPAALKRAFDTGGASVAAGARNFLDDLVNNGGLPRQVDTSPFELGRNLAATPGKVVFRNDLMELIQYEPQTGQVHSVPVLASPPWINKYYIMDLAPGRSFLEWAVPISGRSSRSPTATPTRSMRDMTLDDYLIHGPRTALDVVGDITGAPKTDIVGLCLGGALTAMLAAYLAATGDDRIGSITLLNTLLDYSEPGVLGDVHRRADGGPAGAADAAAGISRRQQMATTFDVLRPNDLIFNYVVSNWLLGQAPPAFDILAWNADSTRMPAAMHSFYLRSLYSAQRTGPRGDGAGRAATVAVAGQERHLHRRRHQRPHRALAGLLQDHLPARRRRAVRALQRRPHRRDRQPARPEAVVRGGRSTGPRDGRAVAGSRGATPRLLVGGLGGMGQRAGLRWYSRRRWAVSATRPPPTHPVPTSTADPAPGSTSTRTPATVGWSARARPPPARATSRRGSPQAARYIKCVLDMQSVSAYYSLQKT